MSHSRNAKMNKNQNHPKVQTNQYLHNLGEPEDNYDFHISEGLELEMLENSYLMKQRIRNHARRMRNFNY
jgi:hypothetical protein